MSLTTNDPEGDFSGTRETVAVYSAPDLIAAGLLQGALAAEGIDAVIGEQVTGAYAGALAVGEGYAAEVRVPAEALATAQVVVREFVAQMASGAAPPFSDEELSAEAEAAYDPKV
ncbi:MAG: DUF2007 domain-containing protein [Cytophagales bacterium]|nr:DUF2007 domain-containing protein [Armatimonadota bacterium]